MPRRYRLWLLRNRVKGMLHCYCVTGNSRWRLAVESSPAKRHTPDVTRPTVSAAECKTALAVSKRRSCVQAVIRRRRRMQNLLETHVSVLSPTPCAAAGRASIDEL